MGSLRYKRTVYYYYELTAIDDWFIGKLGTIYPHVVGNFPLCGSFDMLCVDYMHDLTRF